jgi:hypothetical protein
MLLPTKPSDEEFVVTKFIRGLRDDHPFRKDRFKGTLQEAYKVLQSTTNRCQSDSDSEEGLIVKKWSAAMTKDTIFIGSHQVPKYQYAKFKDDFSQYPIDELPITQLTEMFLAWALASEEQDVPTRNDKTIRRLSPSTLALLYEPDVVRISNPAFVGPPTTPTPRGARPRRGRKKVHAAAIVPV